MPCKYLIYIIAFLSFLSACKDTNSSQSQEIDENNADSLKQIESIAKNEPEQLTIYVWVDNLRMRLEPDTKSDVVTELKEGQAIVFLEEKSNFTQKITLRGKQYDEPWLKVKTKDNKIGWVYGGGAVSYTHLTLPTTPYV